MPGKDFVAIILGSKSDRDIVDESGLTKVLDAVGIPWEISYISAHRNPRELENYIDGHAIDVCIAAASMSAALPGAIAAIKRLVPVIGVPLPSNEFPECQDALLAMVQMPPGMPVLVPGIGKTGLGKAAIAAAQIRAVGSPEASNALDKYLSSNTKKAQLGVDSSWKEV